MNKNHFLCSDEVKINCSFEEGFCFWRHDISDDGDWIRRNGSSFPPLTGPSFDHTFANQSGKLPHLFSTQNHLFQLPVMWIVSIITSLWASPKPHPFPRVLHHNSDESGKLAQGFLSPQPPIGSLNRINVFEILVSVVPFSDTITERMD